ELIELVGLDEKADVRIKTLSGGQCRRLELALGMVGDPDLLFLDEPTTGFDPSARRQAWKVISNLTALGKTVLLTTHYMDEAQHLADRVAIIDRGSIVAHGTPDELGGRTAAATVVSFRLVAPTDLASIPGPPVMAGDRFEIATDEPTRTLHELTGWAIDRGVELEDLELGRPSLEDVYLELTERSDDG
ncbi:MAG: ATP-binding cassette domain-containing protein, partial [Acidimicrobiia bacterium]